MTTRTDGPIVRQTLVFVEFQSRKPGAVSARAKPVALDSTERPARLWTLIDCHDKQHPPALPFVPVHLQNAFMEDHIHDWRLSGSTLSYYSRVMDRGVWVLLEYR